MNKKIIYILLVLLFTVVTCKKDDPIDIPKQEQVKYLAKVIRYYDESSYHVREHCTWDSLKRLKKYEVGNNYSYEFYYDSTSRVSQIDCFDSNIGHFYYLCDWKNAKELNKMDYYSGLYPNYTPVLSQRKTFIYDELNRCIEIKHFYVYDGNNSYLLSHYIEWEEYNIIKVFAAREDEISFINHFVLDNKRSPYSNFPNIIIPIFTGNGTAYNTSENNPIELNNVKYEYDYDKDGYPICKYYIQENGERKLTHIFEYYE